MSRSTVISNKHGAVLVNTATHTAFPPIFVDEDAALSFVEFCGRDPSEFQPETVLMLFAEWKRGITNSAAQEAIDLHLVPAATVANGRKRIGRE